MKKWQIESSATLETPKSWKYYSEFSYFRVFDFALQQNRKLGYKYLGNFFSDISEVSEFLTWLSNSVKDTSQHPEFL